MELSALRDWAQQMGYQGEITESFRSVLTSASFIWAQVALHLKPKEEVVKIRNSILIQQLETRKGNNHLPIHSAILDCRNEDLVIWEKKQEMQDKVSRVKVQLKEKRKQLKQLETQHHVLCTQVEHVNGNVKESETKEYLYRNKHKVQLNDLQIAEAKLFTISKLNRSLDQTQRNKKCQPRAKIKEDIDLLLNCPNLLESDAANLKIRDMYAKYLCNDLWQIIQIQEKSTMEQLKILTEKFHSLEERAEKEYIVLCEDNLIQMHLINIKIQLSIRQLNKQYNELQQEILVKKDEILKRLEQLHPNKTTSDLIKLIDHDLELVEDDAALAVYIRSIHELNQEIFEIDKKFQTSGKNAVKQVQSNLALLFNSLKDQWQSFKPTVKQIAEQRINAHEEKYKLKQLSEGSDTLLAQLASKSFTKELEIFGQYNLKYASALTTADYAFPYTGSADDDVLSRIVSILGVPVTSASELIKYFMSLRRRYEKLRSLEALQLDFNSTNYNALDLKEADSKVNKITEEFYGCVPQLSFWEIKKAAEIWCEMDFGTSIPSSIEYNGHNFQYYEDLYMKYYTQLS